MCSSQTSRHSRERPHCVTACSLWQLVTLYSFRCKYRSPTQGRHERTGTSASERRTPVVLLEWPSWKVKVDVDEVDRRWRQCSCLLDRSYIWTRKVVVYKGHYLPCTFYGWAIQRFQYSATFSTKVVIFPAHISLKTEKFDFSQHENIMSQHENIMFGCVHPAVYMMHMPENTVLMRPPAFKTAHVSVRTIGENTTGHCTILSR